MPGLSWDSAHASVNSRSVIQPIRSTKTRRIMNSVLVPPPTDCVPMSNHARANAREDGGDFTRRILRTIACSSR